MKKIIEYELICEQTYYMLMCKIKDSLDAGYQPLGSPFSHKFSREPEICQAMVKYEEELF